MSKAIQRRRGTTAEHAGFTGLVGELTIDTSKKTAVVHDGVTAGGHPLAKENHNHDTTYAAKAHESSTLAHPEMAASDAEVDSGTGSKWVKVSQLIRATVKTISEILPITLGGTGASTAAGARTNLGLGSVATENTVPVAKGGTGATTAAAARTNLGLGSMATKTAVTTPTGADDSGKVPLLDATGKFPAGFIPLPDLSYVPEAGHATTADSATTAGNADTATSATTAASATNADKVDGYHASQAANPNTIPVADAVGKLSSDWLPAMEAATVSGYAPSVTPGASKIPVADAAGKLASGWLPLINADTVDGYHAQKTAAADKIPVAGSDGKLASSWLPQVNVSVGWEDIKRLSTLPTLSVAAANTVDVSNRHSISTGTTATNGTSYATAYTITVGSLITGTVRYKCSHSSDDSSVELQCLKNGSVVGTWSTSSSTATARSVDISVVPGDVITWRHRRTGGGTLTWSRLSGLAMTANNNYVAHTIYGPYTEL